MAVYHTWVVRCCYFHFGAGTYRKTNTDLSSLVIDLIYVVLQFIYFTLTTSVISSESIELTVTENS